MGNRLPIGPLRGQKIKGLWLNSFRFALGKQPTHEFSGFIFNRQKERKGLVAFFASASYFRSACRLLLRDDRLNGNKRLGEINRTKWVRAVNPEDVKIAKQAIGALKYSHCGDKEKAIERLVKICFIYKELLDNHKLFPEVLAELANFLTETQEDRWQFLADSIVLRIFRAAIQSPILFGQLLENFQGFLSKPAFKDLLINITKGNPMRVYYESVVPGHYKIEDLWHIHEGLYENKTPCSSVRLMAFHAVEWKENPRPLLAVAGFSFDSFFPLAEAATQMLIAENEAGQGIREILGYLGGLEYKDSELTKRKNELLAQWVSLYGAKRVLEMILSGVYYYESSGYQVTREAVLEYFDSSLSALVKEIVRESSDEYILENAFDIICYLYGQRLGENVSALAVIVEIFTKTADATVREKISKKLLSIDEQTAFAAIAQFIDITADPAQKARAIELLVNYPGQRSFNLLKGLLQEDACLPQVRRATCKALLRMERRAALRLVLAEIKDDASGALCSLLDEGAEDKPRRDLLAVWDIFCGHRDEARILAELERHDARKNPVCSNAFLLLAISDEDPMIRKGAVEKIHVGYGTTYGLLSALEGGEDDPATYQAISMLMIMAGHTRAELKLQQIINSNINAHAQDQEASSCLKQALMVCAETERFDLMKEIISKHPELRLLAIENIRQGYEGRNTVNFFRLLRDWFDWFRKFEEEDLLVQALTDVKTRQLRKQHRAIFEVEVRGILDREDIHPYWRAFLERLLSTALPASSQSCL